MNEVLSRAAQFALYAGGGSVLLGALMMAIGAATGGATRKILGTIGLLLFVFGFIVGVNGAIAALPGAQAAMTAVGP